METKIIALEELKAYENNAKEHPREQIEQIKNSIIEFGYNDLIAVDENNVIIEGHGRLMALKELAYEEVEVIVLRHLTEEQKNAYRIVHNQLTMNSGWDMEKLKEELSKISLNMYDFGFEESLLNELEEETREAKDDNFDIDEAYEEIEEPISKYGDVYQLGNHRLICGDSTKEEDIEKLMNGNKADMVVTDPPYNVNYEGGTGMTIQNDNMEDSAFRQFLIDCFANLKNSLKEGGAFYIWFASREHINFEGALKDVGMEVRQELIWVKNSLIIGRQDYQWKHEPCLYGWKDGASHNWYSDRSQTTILEFNKPTKSELHPTMKPLDLIGYQIKNSSKKNDIVLDLFGGSGSTLIACEQLNRTCYMCEYDPKYVDVIIKRFEEFTGKKAVKL